MRQNKPSEKDYAVIGLGRFGTSLALHLMHNGCNVLGIDQDEEIVQRLADQLTQTAALDAVNEKALRELGIQNFQTVVVAIGTDFESNLLVTVALKTMGVRQVICKALTDRQKTILLRVGADRVILPESEAGERLAQELIYGDTLSQFRLGAGYSLVECPTPGRLAGKSLGASDLRGRYGVTVLVVVRNETTYANPAASFVLESGDMLYVVGENNDLARFNELT